MSAEEFQLIDNETNDISNLKRDFMLEYYQHGAKTDDEKQSIIFFFGENLNYTQIRTDNLEFEIYENFNFIVTDDNTNEVFRLVNNAFAFTIEKARSSMSSGTEIKQ